MEFLTSSASELFLLVLMATFAIALLAERVHVPTPIALVLGGMAISLIPEAPEIPLDPDMVFLLFLPPILMEAAYFMSIRDFLRNIWPIGMLAIGMVIVTTLTVGFTLIWLIPSIPPAVAFTLGAIVSPPDAVAATAIARRMHMPKRLATILEGESLVNDASGLILYKFAVAAVVTGAFSWVDAFEEFVWASLGGVSVGFVVAWCSIWLFRRIQEQTLDVITTFIVPYAAYLLAEMVHASGVLSVVFAGFYISWYSGGIFTPEFRLRAAGVWETTIFLMMACVFILIGWQLDDVWENLASYDRWELVEYAAFISLAAILSRLVWVFAITYGCRCIPYVCRREPKPHWQSVLIVGWTGMRGVVSLAAALALPYVTVGDKPFPHRDMLVFLAFSVILATLVIQGLTLPLLLKILRLPTDSNYMDELWRARSEATKAAFQRLDEIEEGEIPRKILKRIKSHYEDRLSELGDGPSSPVYFDVDESEAYNSAMQTESRLWQELIVIERKVLHEMRRERKISDDVMREIEQELDLIEAQHQLRLT